MARSLIDPRDEGPALRRAAVLLERVCQDEREAELELLKAEILRMQQAAANGRMLPCSSLDRMEAVLARIMPPTPCSRDASIHDLLRCNALIETRELVVRLSKVAAVRRRIPQPMR